MTKYGFLYKGSKSGIAEQIVALLPSAPVFVDLFAGGCAVTHAALLSGKFEKVIANDINGAPSLFFDAACGKFANETRWISRDDFWALKDKEPYVRWCWSFSCGGDAYMYSREIEPWKKALHEAIFFKKFGENMFGIDLSPIAEFETVRERQLAARRVVLEKYRKEGAVEKRGSHYSYEGWQLLESLIRLERLQSLESLEISKKDYREVDLPDGAVVYCDIPYRTAHSEKSADYGAVFDWDAFYCWAERCENPIFISEYSMPQGFSCVHEMKKRNLGKGGNTRTATVEKLFRPSSQAESGRKFHWFRGALVADLFSA